MKQPLLIKNEDLEKAREIKAFLEINYSVHYSDDELAKRFGINKLKLKAAFKALTNCKLNQYVTKVRIQNAKLLLENTDKTIKEIANEVGLHKSNFNIQFKHCTGKTPTTWRNHRGLAGDPPLTNTAH